MATEQSIREAFDKQYSFLADYEKEEQYPVFKAGYLALLNRLEPSYIFCGKGMLYNLPKGVTKC